jgi:hypothetical protein
MWIYIGAIKKAFLRVFSFTIFVVPTNAHSLCYPHHIIPPHTHTTHTQTTHNRKQASPKPSLQSNDATIVPRTPHDPYAYQNDNSIHGNMSMLDDTSITLLSHLTILDVDLSAHTQEHLRITQKNNKRSWMNSALSLASTNNYGVVQA